MWGISMVRHPSSTLQTPTINPPLKHIMTANHPTLLEKLPTELLSRVLSLLDNHSVKSLIKAVPTLKTKTVLVTDHNLTPLFFRVKGVRRLYLDDGMRKLGDGYTIYNKNRDRHLITLVEIINRNTQMSFFDAGMTPSVALTETTFMFAMPCLEAYKGIPLDFVRLVVNHSNSKVYHGSPLYHLEKGHIDDYLLDADYSGDFFPNQKPTGYGPHCRTFLDRSLWKKVPLSSSLTTLTVNCTSCFSHCHFPNLKSLKLVFDTDSEPWRVPVISYIYAPFVSRFVVHYNNRVPLFYKMHLFSTGYEAPEDGAWGDYHYMYYTPSTLGEKDRQRAKFPLYGSFELAHTGSLMVHRGPSQATALSNFNYKCYKRTDLDLIQKFRHSSIGVESRALLIYSLRRLFHVSFQTRRMGRWWEYYSMLEEKLEQEQQLFK